jgi:hypothetical protein
MCREEPCGSTREKTMSTFAVSIIIAAGLIGIVVAYQSFADWLDDICRRTRWLP